jgi:hypothetical protein
MAATVLAPSVQSIATRVAGAHNLHIVCAYQDTGHENEKMKKIKTAGSGGSRGSRVFDYIFWIYVASFEFTAA